MDFKTQNSCIWLQWYATTALQSHLHACSLQIHVSCHHLKFYTYTTYVSDVSGVCKSAHVYWEVVTEHEFRHVLFRVDHVVSPLVHSQSLRLSAWRWFWSDQQPQRVSEGEETVPFAFGVGCHPLGAHEIWGEEGWIFSRTWDGMFRMDCWRRQDLWNMFCCFWAIARSAEYR